ncbi:lactoylglutathione lyase [Geodermatophilus arenarius]|uniref:VOC family protein n=1 Tax=Geodermatophilus arenarius TaxID=1137990 RepID=A0ABV9LJD1_9ACTN
MRTLHVGLRVADPERAVAFYTAVGYEVVGRVPETPIGQLTMLKLPGDDVVSVELVFDPRETGRARGTGLSHLVVSVESMDATVADLRAKGIEVADPGSPDGSADFRTTVITDPDGNRIELVQWPPGHPDGLTAADWS